MHNRIIYTDTLKVVSVLAVILYHVCMHYYTYGTPGWNSVIGYSSLTRFCVPIFFMVSGALLLRRAEDISSFFKKRLSKIIIPLVFWSVLYYTFYLFINSKLEDFSFSSAVANVIFTPAAGHLWFVYAILGIYFLVPVLSAISEDRKQSTLIYYTSIWFLFASLLPYIRLFGIDIPANFGSWYFVNEIPQFYNYSGYFTLGYILYNTRESKPLTKLSILAFATSATAMFFLVLFDSSAKKAITQDYWEFKTPLVVIMSASIFYIAKNFNSALSKTQKASSYLSSLTFGVYLCHVAIIYLVCDMYDWTMLSIPLLLRLPAQALIVGIISFSIVAVISKTPILRKVI
ncbi:surface polysaccharide O-acyltransferase-like enzyme [Pseudomonas sp. 29]|uniref:acyltransferase n=1 Tax=Pseudomonas sp. 29 TaxID=2035197 RepID=UPI000C3F94A7|nr:acyltransferase family protein [Pseudomonas sp. 29]PIF52355.1 surface polysaccharide O-acyltransferase-like enzyme [Pseudomonas sp. 29]